MQPYNHFHYNKIREWAARRDFTIPAPEYLPETGYINNNHCAGFLYKTDSKICWLEWVVSNPDSPKEERNLALNELIDKLCDDAQKLGFKAIFTSVEHEGLLERYKKLGFNTTDKSMTNMIRRL
jgi:hypothetical protein